MVTSDYDKGPGDGSRLFISRIDPLSQQRQAGDVSLPLVVALHRTKRTPGLRNRAAEWRLHFFIRLRRQPKQPGAEIGRENAERGIVQSSISRTNDSEPIRVDFMLEELAEVANFQGRKKLRLFSAAAVQHEGRNYFDFGRTGLAPGLKHPLGLHHRNFPLVNQVETVGIVIEGQQARGIMN